MRTSTTYLLFFYFILYSCTSLLAQPVEVTPKFEPIEVTFDLWEAAYLHTATAMDTTAEKYNASRAGSALSFAGQAATAMELMDTYAQEMGMDTARYERFRDHFHAISARESLLEDANKHEVVIINEAHHEPRHRVFARSMLQGLYDQGYRHFGLETLASSPKYDSLALAGDYPKLKGGYYTRDPQFSAMVHDAWQIGFQLFGYEAAGTGSPKTRELGQMRNIMAYRKKHPEGKLLLYVGYSHAYEGQLGGRWDKAMAQRLADTTGLNPLTINQTTFREMSRKGLERYEYQDFAPEEPSLFVDEEGRHFALSDTTRWFDRYLLHPRTTYSFGRPDYVFANGQVPVKVNFSEIDLPAPWLVQAYGKSDDMKDSVPRDVVEMNGDGSVQLALAPGKYRLLVIAQDGTQRVAEIRVK